MEISKYNKAMQFLLKPKYLTKDFIIQAASDAQPGTSNEQLDTNDNVTIETKPGFFPDMSGSTPPMDKVMPSFDGLEDPRMRQVELAEGGTVNYNRNPGGSNQYETKTLEEIQQIIEANPDLTAKDLEGYGKESKGRLLTRDDLKKAKAEGIEPKVSGKRVYKDPRERDVRRLEKLNPVQGGAIMLEGSRKLPDGKPGHGKEFSHVFPFMKGVPQTTKMTGVISGTMNRKLQPFNVIGQKIADEQYFIKNNDPTNKKKLIELNALAKQNVEKAITKLGKEYKGNIGYYQINPDNLEMKPKAGNWNNTFAGVKGKEESFLDMGAKGRANFQKKESKKLITEFLNPQEQTLVKKFGDQVNSGVPIDEIINALPAKEAQILKAMGSKIGNIAKLGVRGVAELTVGLGPLGAGITALVTAPLALYNLSEGDRGSEVIQNTASDLTFGLTPRADERIIREIGGESAVRGFGIQQKIDEYKSAKENLKNLNEQLNDPSSTLFSEDQDSLLASIERNKNIIKENETFLQTLVNDQGKLISPDYTNYLKAADRQKLEKEITKQTRLERYDIDGGSDETQTEFNSPQLEQLKNLKGSLEKTYIGNQDKPKPYPSLMQGTVGEPIDNILNRNYAYAVGGRVGFKKGSKPPK